MRLFMTADAVGGVWTYALDLARGLSDRGVKTTLAVLGPRPDAARAARARATPGLELLETDLPLDWAEPDPAARGGGLRRARPAGGAGRCGRGADQQRRRSPRPTSPRRWWSPPTPASRPGTRRCGAVRFPPTSPGARPWPRAATRRRLSSPRPAAPSPASPPSSTACAACRRSCATAAPRRARTARAPRPPSPRPPMRSSPRAGSGTRARTWRRSTAPRLGSRPRSSPQAR